MAVKMGEEALEYWRNKQNRVNIYRTLFLVVVAVGVVALKIYYS